MLSRDSEDEMWSRFMFELLIWPQEVTLARWTQPWGPLCLLQYFSLSFINCLLPGHFQILGRDGWFWVELSTGIPSGPAHGGSTIIKVFAFSNLIGSNSNCKTLLQQKSASSTVSLLHLPGECFLENLRNVCFNKIGIAMSPLSNNSLFLNYNRSPFPDYLARWKIVLIDNCHNWQFGSMEQRMNEKPFPGASTCPSPQMTPSSSTSPR